MQKRFVKNILIILLLISSLVGIQGCFIVKPKGETKEEMQIQYIPSPQIEMSEEPIRSEKGDMIIFTPKNWFFVNLGENTPNDVIAIAVNQDYTLSLVLSSFPTNDMLDEIYNQQHLIGLANATFEKRQRKASGSLIQIGKFSTFKAGNLEFVVYKFRNRTQPVPSINAVFKSSIGQIYEINLIPMNIIGLAIPTESEMNSIFFSVLSTIRY
jgi:hypothetical protein